MDSGGEGQKQRLTALAQGRGLTAMPLILDGGLATDLEEHGHDLHHALWSGQLALQKPEAIRQSHARFAAAGAELIITASYQMWPEGLQNAGASDWQAVTKRVVDLARQAAPNALVAGSIGPYGATLADGSEFRGDYEMSREDLRYWHRERWHAIAATQPDLLLCETIPSRDEVAVLAEFASTVDLPVAISLSCRSGQLLADGSDLAEVVGLIENSAVAGVGVNCCSPTIALEALQMIARHTTLPLHCYPNRGERWDGDTRQWQAAPSELDWQDFLHAALSGPVARQLWALGGCCRVTPDMIREVRLARDSDKLKI